MGFIQAVKEIIAKLREMGKTETEIEDAIQTAADKEMIKCGTKKKEEQQETTEELQDVLSQKTREAELAMTAWLMARARENRRNTNNWRKMHGLPMRRRRKARSRNGKGKRADSHREDHHIS